MFLCEFGCISTTLCYDTSFGTSFVGRVYELSRFFTILVHMRCHVCVYDPHILCLFAIFSPPHHLMRSKVQMPYVPLIGS